MANPRKSVLITGGCGFLGSHLAEHFLQLGYTTIAVDNLCTALESNVDYLKKVGGKHLTFIESDVSLPWQSWLGQIPNSALENLEYVFHWASPASPPLYQELAEETLWVNTVGLKNALEFADKYSARCIYASTSEIYGDPSVHPQPESYWGNVNTLGPRSCYDEAKRFGESILYTHNWKRGTQHGLLRIFNTYGPRMHPKDGRVVVNLLSQAMKSEPMTVYGEGKQTRSFCYVSDLIEGITRYAESKLTEAVNLGNPNEFSILELAEAVKKVCVSSTSDLRFEAMPVDDPKQRQPDISKAKELLNWQPKVELNEGLEKMKNWLEEKAPV